MAWLAWPAVSKGRGRGREAAEGTGASQDLVSQAPVSVRLWPHLPGLGKLSRLMECNKDILNPSKERENGA